MNFPAYPYSQAGIQCSKCYKRTVGDIVLNLNQNACVCVIMILMQASKQQDTYSKCEQHIWKLNKKQSPKHIKITFQIDIMLHFIWWDATHQKNIQWMLHITVSYTFLLKYSHSTSTHTHMLHI